MIYFFVMFSEQDKLLFCHRYRLPSCGHLIYWNIISILLYGPVLLWGVPDILYVLEEIPFIGNL